MQHRNVGLAGSAAMSGAERGWRVLLVWLAVAAGLWGLLGCANSSHVATRATTDEAVASVASPSAEQRTTTAAARAEMSQQERNARVESLTRQGLADLAAGRLAEALRRFHEILTLAPHHADAWVQVAAVHVQRGDRREAVASLQRAAEAGFLNFDAFREHPDLADLHGYGPFERLLRERDHYVEQVAQKRLDAMKWQWKLGPGYTYHFDRAQRLIVATDRPQWMVEAILESLAAYAEALGQHLFANRPRDYLAVLVPSLPDFERLLANPVIGGVYVPERRLLIAREPDYMLRHEFTHYLHFADLEHYERRQNVWFLEGVATLFENSVIDERTGEPVPVSNSRQNLLQLLATRDELTPWRTMMAMEPARFMENAPALYAQVRYICWWLWQQGKLREVHERYAATVAHDPAGIGALEAVLGMPLEQAEQQWRQWVRTELPYFYGLAEPGRAFLGLNLHASYDGVFIAGITRDGPAAQAGLRTGDRILRFAQRPVIGVEDVMDELLVRQPAVVVALVYERAGERHEAEVELGIVPTGRLPEPDFEQPLSDHTGE